MEVMTETPALHHVHQSYKGWSEYTRNDMLSIPHQWNALYFGCQDEYMDFEVSKRAYYSFPSLSLLYLSFV